MRPHIEVTPDGRTRARTAGRGGNGGGHSAIKKKDVSGNEAGYDIPLP